MAQDHEKKTLLNRRTPRDAPTVVHQSTLPPSKDTRTLVIGTREVVIASLAFAILALATFVFVMGIVSFGSGGTEQETLLLTATPVAGIDPQMPGTSDLTPTQVLAPTIEPTPIIVKHIVRLGESLISIATLYGVDLQTLLDANEGLTLNSILWEGQEILVPILSTNGETWHEVQSGETLTAIAALYGVAPELIQAANNLPDPDAIYVGQRLRIPNVESDTPPADAPTPAPTTPFEAVTDGPLMSDWPRSLWSHSDPEALRENYPLIYEHARFTLHYQPGTYPDLHLEKTAQLIADALSRVEATLKIQLTGKFDIYTAGTLFTEAHLHGISRSPDRIVFTLYDGSGTDVDNTYFFTHEITHLVSWNMWGRPSSTMLSEGLATYTGYSALEEGGFIPLDQLCLGMYAAGEMPSMYALENDWQSFEGHIRHRFNYFGSGCFVKYLIETYGLGLMSQLYHLSNYSELYGASLYDMNEEWQVSLAARQSELEIDPDNLSLYTEKVTQVFELVFDNYNGTELMHQAYAIADKARIALWKGDYETTQYWLDQFYALTGFPP